MFYGQILAFQAVAGICRQSSVPGLEPMAAALDRYSGADSYELDRRSRMSHLLGNRCDAHQSQRISPAKHLQHVRDVPVEVRCLRVGVSVSAQGATHASERPRPWARFPDNGPQAPARSQALNRSITLAEADAPTAEADGLGACAGHPATRDQAAGSSTVRRTRAADTRVRRTAG